MILIRITNEENNSFSFTRVGIEEETAGVVVSITLVPNIFNSIDEKSAGNEKSSLERSVGIETGSFSSKDKANSIPFTQIIIQLLQGFLCFGIAWVLNFIKLVIE